MSNRTNSRELLPECPSLPISGRHGSRMLCRLRRRAEWLKRRIEAGEEAGKNLGFDKAELSALDWTIKHVLELEEDLKTYEETGGAHEESALVSAR